MPKQIKRDEHSDKFARYRATKRARGMKLLRIWVPDPNAQGFTEEAERQAALLRGAPEEAEVIAFIEAVGAWPEEPYDWGPDGPPGSAEGSEATDREPGRQ
jgi:antidote-toxin recognition MazE-like antitoxin